MLTYGKECDWYRVPIGCKLTDIRVDIYFPMSKVCIFEFQPFESGSPVGRKLVPRIILDTMHSIEFSNILACL